MMMKVLTKSRFKLGLECPNKLYFTSKKDYANNKNDNPFMDALAEGGFQVEELARMQYTDGILIDVEHYEYERAVELTNQYLRKENVVIFEAAFLYEGLFIRTDILVKRGYNIELIEVKAKSYDPGDDYTFIGKRGKIVSSWKPYLFDLAFQKYVLHKSYPDYNITAYLMLVDKTKRASVDGLNQMFRIPKKGEGNQRTDIIKKFHSADELGESILFKKDVDGIIENILTNKYTYYEGLLFQEAVKLFRDAYLEDRFLNWETNFTACKNCEFKTTETDKSKGLLSGFEYCFKKLRNWTDQDFKKPNAFEIWDFKGGKKLMDDERLFLYEINEDDLNVKPEAGRISHSERQMKQVDKSRGNDNTIFFLKEELKEEMENWIFPLHFIDFETSAVALPFHKGRRPYESVAFQFSHHQYNQDGTIEHKTEFISNKAGEFPNFEFVRVLKNSLDKDNGSVFKFAVHENTILNHIIVQLEESEESDKDELIAFLMTLTNKKGGRIGERDMIDLRKVYINYIYNPYTKGSNSIKEVLPACLNSSDYLKKKYSKPIGELNLTSNNFDSNHIWLKKDNGVVVNPYKLLPEIFEDWTSDEMDSIVSGLEDESIANGGAALTAYAKLQFMDMTDEERIQITQSLLKYCELDTLAMAMIYEHFKHDLLVQ